MNPELRVELQRLLSALCDGELGDEQHARLEELLAGDVECRRLYLAYLDMHAHLLVQPHLGDVQEYEPAAAATVAATGRRHVPALVRYGLVVVATLAASLLFQLYWLRPPAAEPVGGGQAGPVPVKQPRPLYLAT